MVDKLGGIWFYIENMDIGIEGWNDPTLNPWPWPEATPRASPPLREEGKKGIVD